MPTIRLIRSVTTPHGRGPTRGQFALQKAIQEAAIPWLQVGDSLRPGEIPWIWSFQDAAMAVQLDEWGWPFVIGPNVLFFNSYQPGAGRYEKRLLNARHCDMMFTESNWYANLIQQHCDKNEAPIVIWPYPIDLAPDGPLEPEFDLLIYLKDMAMGREQIRLTERFPKSVTVVYGHYQREEMIELARRSRCCVYLSNDDRGPLAAAEIALTGCPLVGVERGCPWVCMDGLGVEVPHWGTPVLLSGIESAMSLDRESVRVHAQDFFSAERTVNIIKTALEPIAKE